MGVAKNSAIFLFAFVALGAVYVDGFPDGAPVDVCVKPKPNRPYHGNAEPQPLAQSPYQITASSGVYQPGGQVTGISKTLYIPSRTSINNKINTKNT